MYKEYEPLIFQLQESSDTAYNRIRDLARNCREGYIKKDSPHTGWLSSKTGYYAVNTIYRILSPLAIFRLMERSLTTFDLGLNSNFECQYLFAKALYHILRKDHQLAKGGQNRKGQDFPEIDYKPHEHPGKYTQQVIHLGEIDRMTEAIIKKSDGIWQVISFGEFQDIFSQGDKVHNPFCNISSLFSNFHPKTSPVLWRMLLTQAYIYRVIITTYRKPNIRNLLMSSISISEKEYEEFYWEEENEKDSYFDKVGGRNKGEMYKVTNGNFKAAEKYLETYLHNILEDESSKRTGTAHRFIVGLKRLPHWRRS